MSEIASEGLNSELIIGIVSAVGSENFQVIDLLKEQLGRAGYRVEMLKVSGDVIPTLYEVPPHNHDNYKRISDLMDAGNAVRELANNDAVLALGASTKIATFRTRRTDGTPDAMSKTAVIIDSLKRPEEVEELRRIYPSGFVLIGIHTEEHRRLRHLIKDLNVSEVNAKKLVQRDVDESSVKHGQRVNKTFHLADFFVQSNDSRKDLRGDIKRMVELWFGNPFITPTFDEHAMFLAFSSALRSADLSRQVGAVVARDSQILSTGANECPQAGGGTYWPTRQDNGEFEDLVGGRDHTREDGDTNRAEQNRIIERIVQEGSKPAFGLDAQQLRKLLEASRIRDLTEFGRVVHAEMEAILSCARNGLSTVGASLYCTTFPCHNCAKHIVAAGMVRVVYVEPYPKSKALEFHSDSICTDEPKVSDKRVRFEPFVGIGPRRFFDLFSMHLGSSYPLERKDPVTGKRREWSIERAELRIQMKAASYLELEAEACSRFGEITGRPEQTEESS